MLDDLRFLLFCVSGEYGRNGLLITPEFGPRLRIGKIFTNLPMVHDRPVRFGVKEFCDICRLCAKNCPAKVCFLY